MNQCDKRGLKAGSGPAEPHSAHFGRGGGEMKLEVEMTNSLLVHPLLVLGVRFQLVISQTLSFFFRLIFFSKVPEKMLSTYLLLLPYFQHFVSFIMFTFTSFLHHPFIDSFLHLLIYVFVIYFFVPLSDIPISEFLCNSK